MDFYKKLEPDYLVMYDKVSSVVVDYFKDAKKQFGHQLLLAQANTTKKLTEEFEQLIKVSENINANSRYNNSHPDRTNSYLTLILIRIISSLFISTNKGDLREFS